MRKRNRHCLPQLAPPRLLSCAAENPARRKSLEDGGGSLGENDRVGAMLRVRRMAVPWPFQRRPFAHGDENMTALAVRLADNRAGDIVRRRAARPVATVLPVVLAPLPDAHAHRPPKFPDR